MSDITVAPPADLEELKAFLPVHRRTYLIAAEDAESWLSRQIENVRIAKRGGKAIGGMTLVPMGQWFGGRSVPMTGISSVGIEPAERASGGGTEFMAQVLTELHNSGVALSSLYPATQTVYRRCGYELAGDHIRYVLETDDANVRDRGLKVELTTDRDAIAALYNARALRTAGVLDRPERMWQRVFEPWNREADAYLVTGDDGPEGYVVYNRTPGEAVRGKMWADVCALTPAAVRRIISFIADHRSFVETFNWNGAPADPFTFHLSEPRRKVQLSWPWMLRIIDVASALTARGYPAGVDAEVHLRVADDLIASNDGDFVLKVSGGKAEVTSGGEGRLRVDIRGLAPLYSGYTSAHELLAIGYIDGSEDDLAAASAVFAGPAPWLADFF